ncbi:MAG: MgtC/SapB family protein [Candidatus Acidiferrales bacterium]
MFVNRFPPAEVAAKIAVSLGIGLLVGIEREWSNKDLGARTFALTALLGTLAVLFAPSMAIMSLVGVLLIVIFANARSLMVDRSLEATTSAALLVIFVLGALVGQGHLFTPVAAAILMTLLLTWKVKLHRFAGGLQPAEIHSAVLLALLALVVYPILPGGFIDKWQLINPREVWLTVIVIAGIGFVNYVLLKSYGARGLYLSGFLGGSVNSSAAAVELAKPLGAGGASLGVAVAALLLTIVAMFVRNLIILALFAPSAVYAAVGPIVAMTVVALLFVRRARTGDQGAPAEIHLESPVSLKRVLSFAFFFLVIQIISTLGERYLGKLGFLGVTVLGGLVSSASTSAAAANMVGQGQMQPGLAGAGVVLASVASALINLPIIHRTARNPALSRRLTVLTLFLSALGILILLLQSYLGSIHI